MRPKPALVTSVRDILQERVKAGRNEETVEIVNRHFDLVMVHGDPAFATLGDTFPLAASITAEIAYTGLVAAPRPTPSPERYEVLFQWAAARPASCWSTRPSRPRRVCRRQALVPDHRPQPAAGRFRRGCSPRRRAGLDIVRFRKDFPALLAAAELSVSQAGYNTVCDVLQAGCRSILVPFAAGGETEQTVRAERLQRLGLAVVAARGRAVAGKPRRGDRTAARHAKARARTGSTSTARGNRREVLRAPAGEAR